MPAEGGKQVVCQRAPPCREATAPHNAAADLLALAQSLTASRALSALYSHRQLEYTYVIVTVESS